MVLLDFPPPIWSQIMLTESVYLYIFTVLENHSFIRKGAVPTRYNYFNIVFWSV